MLSTNSGAIVLTVLPQANGHYVCEATPTLEGRPSTTQRFHGQNPKHAIAIALENLARAFRAEAEAEQKIDCDAVHRSPSGEVIDQLFHVILHYERLIAEESKFEAMHNTMLGNTVVENAEIAIIQVSPNLPVKTLQRQWPPS